MKAPAIITAVLLSVGGNPSVAGEPLTAKPLPAEANMIQQHLDAAMIHSAFVDGDFRGTRRRALTLAGRSTPTLPATLAPRFERMKTMAKQVAETGTATEMARAVTAMADSCRDCHQAVDASPPWRSAVLGSDDNRRGHAVAASLMWHALIFNDADAWRQGTTLLREDIAMVQDPTSPTLKLLEKQVGELGLQGDAAAVSWGRHYSTLLESCIACHALTETD